MVASSFGSYAAALFFGDDASDLSAKLFTVAILVVMFSINPVWRGETQGTYSLVLNTVMNFDSLDVGRKDADK